MPEQTGIAVAADFTAGPIAASLEFWARQFGWTDEVRLAPYHQVIQTLLDPLGSFAMNRTGMNVLLLRRVTGELSDAVGSYRASGGAPLIVVFCGDEDGALEHATLDAHSVHIVRFSEIDRLYPVRDKVDAHAQLLADVPYTPLYFAALGTMVARTIHALRMHPFKVIALDCDNTLWKGTCGEDGPENVVVDAARRCLHNFMLLQRDRGMLLALASKNNLADVQDTFRLHPEMPLQWQDFIAHRINWDSKGPNLRSIAAELNVGIDSFIFVDDNPKETGEVQAACPEALSLTLPHDESRIPHFLDHVWAFDHLRVTEEDRKRNESYRQQIERGNVAKAANTLGNFIEQLQVEVHLQPLQPAQVARVTQLTQRTNQMNTTLVRRDEAEVAAFDPANCLTVDVTDRFGSYGLVGAIFLNNSENALKVDSLLLSCRALGRGVEHQMLAHLGRIAEARGLPFVDIRFVEGPRNAPALQFLDSLPLVASMGDKPSRTYRISAPICAGLRYEPGAAVHLVQETSTKDLPTIGQSFRDYARIARELSRPQQILDAIGEEKRRRNANMAATDPPRTELERQVGALWTEVLHVASPGREDDFFDLGGHSLVAVQLLSRVRQDLGVDLSLDLVYSGKLTIASMAAAVELAQADPEEVNRLLAEIENLSDEELQALLENEEA